MLPKTGTKIDWYVGDVLRITKPHWCDVNYADGKLWMRTKISERGELWHVVSKRG